LGIAQSWILFISSSKSVGRGFRVGDMHGPGNFIGLREGHFADKLAALIESEKSEARGLRLICPVASR